MYSNRFGTADFSVPVPKLSPFSQRLPVMKRRCLPVAASMPKSFTVSRQAFEQPLQRTVRCVGASASISSRDKSPLRGTFGPRSGDSGTFSVRRRVSSKRSRANNAAPKAPMLPAMSGRMAFTSESCSKARSTASFKKVPPCTMTFVPTSCGSRILMTLNRAFLTTEIARPAAMSPTVAPSFWACFTRLFMNTVQRLPRSTGFSAEMAVAANSATSRFRPLAKDSMKLPQPEEQASFSMMWSMTPSFTRKHFMSWPPMSRMNSTPGSISWAPRKWATVSISPESTRRASSSSPSP